ncbi:Urea transporter [Pandoraea pneumonica]|uniref:Urea transporter n=1 Tax=Pandoraea pneumonica TaxID=2508299 RepID=A0A5E4TTN9_9BURK|nr:urea transporter [Pandoraea pneumonica]VVD89389.1 Urea transporter [Pandoraea pneumonica]
MPTPPLSASAAPAFALHRWLKGELGSVTAHFAQIYFIPSAGIGMLLFAVLWLADRPAALMGLAASVGATFIALVLRLPRDARRNGLFGYNGALTGIAFGALWQPDIALAVWLSVCVGLTVIASAELARRQLPALTGPFVGVMALSWAMQPWLGLLPRASAFACDTGTPGFVFCSVGQVVFVGPLVLGLLTWYVLALWNARATVWALAAGIATWLGIALLAQHWPALAVQAGGIGVNGFLAALGLGVFHRSPAVRLAGAVLAGLICVALGSLLAPIGWPYFTLPFNLAVWTLLVLTRNVNPR